MKAAELNRILPASQAHPALHSSLTSRPRLISQIQKGSGYYIVV
jgi:hypothetical protein